MATGNYRIFELENLTLQRGITLPRAEIAYKTYGRLADDKSNVILYPTSYGAQHHDTEWLIGPGRVLDPNDWFIVIPNMFGNGLSTSPSNLTAPFGPDRYPTFTHWDNVHAQRRLLKAVFGVERLAFPVEIHELKGGEKLDRSGYSITAVKVDHRVSALGYVIE